MYRLKYNITEEDSLSVLTSRALDIAVVTKQLLASALENIIKEELDIICAVKFAYEKERLVYTFEFASDDDALVFQLRYV